VEDGSSSSFQAANHRSSSNSFPAAGHRSSSSFPAASHDILSLVPKKSPSDTSDKRKTEGRHEKEGQIEEERQTDTRERKGEEREEGERKPVESLAGEREHRVPNISALRYTSGGRLLLRFKRTVARDCITVFRGYKGDESQATR
jgi:hypothetical protein